MRAVRLASVAILGNLRGGTNRGQLVEPLELSPTLSGLAVLPKPPQPYGTSLARLQTDPERSYREAAYAEHIREQ